MSAITIREVDPMQKARAAVVMKDPFFGTLLLRMKMEADPTCETAWTDGVTIGYNPKFVASLDSEERQGLLVHEIMHPALMHHVRRGARDQTAWNIACDYALNPLINKKYKLPKDALDNPAYHNKAAEEIYTLLPKGAGSSKFNNFGEVRDAPGDNKQSQTITNKQQEAEWKQALAQARHVAKMQGRMPADLDKLIDEALEPVVDWPNVLRRFATEKMQAEESWNRANRRFIADNLYLPSRHENDAVGPIVIFRDTSGSIYCDPEALQQFMGEMQSIVDDVQPTKTYIIDVDAHVAQVIEVDRGDPLPYEVRTAKGGGGTSFVPGFEWLRKNNIEPKCAIYLTDGYGSFPREKDVDFPVMWAMTTDVKPPFGETVKL